MDVSIIIINYKSAKLVLDCIDSIYQQTRQYQFEIILVDNDSNDNCKDLVLAKYAAVRWLQTGYNAGFARANNAGIKVADGEHILLLNADTIILDNAIDKSISLLKKYPGAAGCGVQLLNPDGTTQISGAHFIKGGLNALLPLPYLGSLVRYLGYKFKSTVPSVQDVQQDTEVDWVVGAFMMVKAETLKKSGLMDEDFFMYSEEIEWCARLRKEGKLVLFAAPKVIHLKGGTSSEYYDTTETENGENLWNKKARQIIVSNMLRIRKQYGVGFFLLINGLYVFDIPVFFCCLLLSKIFTGGKGRYTWKIFNDFSSNILVLLRYFIKILFNQRHFYKVS